MRKNPPFPAPYPPNLRTYPPIVNFRLYERRISANLVQESAISNLISAKFTNLSAKPNNLALRKKDIRQSCARIRHFQRHIRQVCEFIRQS
ncbi:hypothetical protein [Ureibacillus sp. FSL W7-1570]|uniref:hypothetical protein n=1 Tax=Ureibacillus sp. FSL W7-1570 TaxID=2954593 RepID=UPI00315A0A48